jgi:uncharacterized protein with FMN-binding domain
VRRALLAVIATAAGVVWLVTFRVTPHTREVAAAAPPGTPAATPTPSQTGPTAPPTPTPTPSPTPANRAANGNFTGQVVSTFYGDVQVRVTIAGGRITDVSALRMPSDRARSAEITQIVTPELRTEAIQAQSARIDIISGATFTSEAYAESLDDALRQDRLA